MNAVRSLKAKKEVDVKIIRVVIGAFLAIGLSSVASAQSFDTKNLFFGGGLSQNKISGGSGSGMGYSSSAVTLSAKSRRKCGWTRRSGTRMPR